MSITGNHIATLAERVAAAASSLTASEQRVAQWLADHPQEVAFGSAEQLGRATGTSDATVIRTVKALGYQGLPALKRSLQESLREKLTPAGRLTRTLDTIGEQPESVLTQVFEQQLELLQEARRTLQPEEFHRAVELVAGSRETVVAAIGNLGALAEYLVRKLVRLQERARAATSSGFLLADDLVGLTGDDVVILIAHAPMLPEAEVVLRHANRVKAEVVLITDSLGVALADRIAACLSAPISRTGMFSAHTTTLVTMEALAFGIASRRREHAVAALDQLNELRAELKGAPIPNGDTPGTAGRRRKR